MAKLYNLRHMAAIVSCCLVWCAQAQKTCLHEYAFEAQPVDLKMTPAEDGHKVEGFSAFQVQGHFTWGASVTKAEDGKYYMIYSAPETGMYPFTNAWVFGSKLGLAVSDKPDGGFKHLGFFYNADGFTTDKSAWDAQSASNPHVRKFGNTYYPSNPQITI